MKPSRPTMKINGWTVPLTMRTGVGCLVVTYTAAHLIPAGARVDVWQHNGMVHESVLDEDANEGDEITVVIPMEGEPR